MLDETQSDLAISQSAGSLSSSLGDRVKPKNGFWNKHCGLQLKNNFKSTFKMRPLSLSLEFWLVNFRFFFVFLQASFEVITGLVMRLH